MKTLAKRTSFESCLQMLLNGLLNTTLTPAWMHVQDAINKIPGVESAETELKQAESLTRSSQVKAVGSRLNICSQSNGLSGSWPMSLSLDGRPPQDPDLSQVEAGPNNGPVANPSFLE
ncbi:unnamed protein product [Effrenium voratum]|uniref:Uncharacterized protein n=1 Tax=Effrenium voratum TaxID=2562239 RepID=A0AA36JM31_9DINO|nr:unnamed protein product [Effrenium voratum]CAJ1434641.1 unnamed protein product [Effrenium voratum]